MSWQVEVVEQLRVLLGDIDCTPLYADSRLERTALVAANIVLGEIEFDNQYVVDISNQTITPDPTDTTVVSFKDNVFLCLIALKAASLVARGELKLAANAAGFIVKDGPSSIDTSTYYSAKSTLYKQFVEDYEFLKLNYKIFYSNANAQAILTPTTVLQIYGNLQVLSY